MAAHTTRHTVLRGRRTRKPENIMKFASVIDSAAEAAAMKKKTPAIIPKPPELLDAVAHREWARVIKILEEKNMISPMYMTMLASYCDAWAMRMKAVRKLKKLKNEYVEVGKDGGHFQNLWMAIYNKADEKVYRLSALFGFSPNDDIRMRAGGAPLPKEKNDFEGM